SALCRCYTSSRQRETYLRRQPARTLQLAPAAPEPRSRIPYPIATWTATPWPYPDDLHVDAITTTTQPWFLNHTGRTRTLGTAWFSAPALPPLLRSLSAAPGPPQPDHRARPSP